MLTRLTVRNFRNLQWLVVEELGRITLIGGKNGVGKTALLEALWIFSAPDLPELSDRINVMRGLPPFAPEDIFHDLFSNYDASKNIKISAYGDWESNLSRSLDISLQPRSQSTQIRPGNLEQAQAAAIERTTRPRLEGESALVFKYKHSDGRTYESSAWWIADQVAPAGTAGPVLTGEGIAQNWQSIAGRPISLYIPALYREDLQSIAAKFSRVQVDGNESRLIDLLNILEPRLRRLALIQVKNTSVIHAFLDNGKRPIPVQLLGEGFNRILSIALSMGEASGGLFLVDEIENGLHHSVQEDVFAMLLDLAREFDVQVFATTHSDECIRAAHRAMRGNEREFSYYRLENVDAAVKAVHFDADMMETSIKHSMEIR